jgi:hypothetical protein
MTKQSRPLAAVWILRIEDQPNGLRISVTNRSDLVAHGVDSATAYRDVSSALSAIAESAARFVRKCGFQT